ncbi:phosphotransferase enzyme family domain-containing protein [Fonsecaea pedrosoi]|nr:phosphotransferase enzyme family domain-containing protein [Fonsecaea pedrosoi]
MVTPTADGLASRHGLDDAALGQYLVGTPSMPPLKLPVVSTKIGYGQSNPTYYVDDAAGTRLILRKKPAGQIISKVAHQVDREYRVLKALGTVEGFPVPKVYALCMDDSVIGTAFYVMEFVKGRIFTDYSLPELSPSDRRKAWFSLVETLAWLHSIDPFSIGLEGFGKTTGFYARHCNTFARIEAEQAKITDSEGKPLGRAHEHYDEILDYVRRNLPGDRYAIVHGDYKFDNVILHPTEPRVIAILDWELSTIGHPLMDAVFIVSSFWNEKYKNATGGSGVVGAARSSTPLSTVSGVPSADELIDRYSEIVGFDPRKEGGGKDWEVAKIFHHVRGSTITHGIQARTIRGQASSEFSHLYFEYTKSGLDIAWRIVQELKASETPLAKI